MQNIKKNKRAWIKLVEAFFAVLLMVTIMGIIIEQKYSGEKDISSEVYEQEFRVLREIQTDKTLRETVLGETPPISTIDTDPEFPLNIKNKIGEMPSYLDCAAKICLIDDDCYFPDIVDEVDRDIYTRSVGIFADNTNTHPDPRKLKLFCCVREE